MYFAHTNRVLSKVDAKLFQQFGHDFDIVYVPVMGTHPQRMAELLKLLIGK